MLKIIVQIISNCKINTYPHKTVTSEQFPKGTQKIVHNSQIYENNHDGQLKYQGEDQQLAKAR